MMFRQARDVSPINHSDDASAKKCFALELRNEAEGLKKKLS